MRGASAKRLCIPPVKPRGQVAAGTARRRRFFSTMNAFSVEREREYQHRSRSNYSGTPSPEGSQQGIRAPGFLGKAAERWENRQS